MPPRVTKSKRVAPKMGVSKGAGAKKISKTIDRGVDRLTRPRSKRA